MAWFTHTKLEVKKEGHPLTYKSESEKSGLERGQLPMCMQISSGQTVYRPTYKIKQRNKSKDVGRTDTTWNTREPIYEKTTAKRYKAKLWGKKKCVIYDLWIITTLTYTMHDFNTLFIWPLNFSKFAITPSATYVLNMENLFRLFQIVIISHNFTVFNNTVFNYI